MRVPAALTCLLLAGCGAAGEATPEPISCASLPLEGRYVTIDITNCHGCSVYDEKQAVDGDLATFATARIPASTEGPLRLRAGNLGRAPEDARAAGAVLQVTGGSLDHETEVDFLITLRGQAQASTLGFKPALQRRDALERLSFEAPVAFDELELRLFQRDQQDLLVQVHELCRA